MVLDPKRIDPPLMIFFLFTPWRCLPLKAPNNFIFYRTRVGAGIGQTLAAAVAGLRAFPYHRQSDMGRFSLPVTNRFSERPNWPAPRPCASPLLFSIEEILLLAALVSMAAAIAMGQKLDTLDLILWVVVLLVQALPYAATRMYGIDQRFAQTQIIWTVSIQMLDGH